MYKTVVSQSSPSNHNKPISIPAKQRHLYVLHMNDDDCFSPWGFSPMVCPRSCLSRIREQHCQRGYTIRYQQLKQQLTPQYFECSTPSNITLPGPTRVVAGGWENNRYHHALWKASFFGDLRNRDFVMVGVCMYAGCVYVVPCRVYVWRRRVLPKIRLFSLRLDNFWWDLVS